MARVDADDADGLAEGGAIAKEFIDIRAKAHEDLTEKAKLINAKLENKVGKFKHKPGHDKLVDADTIVKDFLLEGYAMI